MKKSLIIGVITIIFIVAFIIFLPEKQRKVCVNEECFYVEIADNSAERQRGLMFRESLNEGEGMLFIFPEQKIHSFWMKNTLIPLDIIWINENKEIVFIKENSQPLNETLIVPDKEAKYVLELNAGIVNNSGIKLGDSAIINL